MTTTITVQTADHAAHAVLVDDIGGPNAAHRVDVAPHSTHVLYIYKGRSAVIHEASGEQIVVADLAPAEAIAGDGFKMYAGREDVSVDASPATVAGLPVAGYRPQSKENVDDVNVNKALEEIILRRLDDIADARRCDPRWLAIGRTHIQEAFMAINRAIFQPQRVEVVAGDVGIRRAANVANVKV
jgi:hypothetical protein